MEKSSLLEQWKRKKSDTPAKSIQSAPDGIPIPLSHGQQRLWFLQQLYPDNPLYNYSEVYSFSGDVQVDFLIQALDSVFQSHDILRTVYVTEDGRPFMRMAPEAAISQTHHDLRMSEDVEKEVSRIQDADANHSFDLSEPPVALLSVIRVEEDAYRVMLTLHHIATDKWSMNLLRSEWAENYRTLCTGETPEPQKPDVQYPDFAYWQRDREIKWEQVDYWRRKLSGDIPRIDLPTDYHRPKELRFAGRSSEFYHLSAERSEAVLRRCKQWGVTPYVFFLSIYYLFLYRYTGQHDILIGSPISNRDQKALEKTIGFFNDTIVLRTEIPPEGSFLDLLREVKKSTLEAFSNKDVPFDFLVRELQQERSLSINPFFQVMFLYYSVSEPESFGEGVQVDYDFYNPGVSKFDLTFDVAEENGKLSFAFEYSTELFKEKTIGRFLDGIALLMKGVVEAPERAISKVEILTAEEKEFLLPSKSISSDTFKEFTGIHQAIEKMVDERPDATAVTFGDNSMTYAELDAKANVLAARVVLKIRGDRPNAMDEEAQSTKVINPLVGLCVERSLDMIVGLLAILKAGCAYVPIDPKYPIDRVDYMLQDANIELLITQKKLACLFDKSTVAPLMVDESYASENCISQKGIADNSTSEEKSKEKTSKGETLFPEMPVLKRDDLAYVIYTSGSTGRPKGVPITHDNILNSTAGRLDFYPQKPKAFLLLSSISFDSSKAGIFWTLCTGGNLIVTEDRIEQDMHRLGEIIQRNQVSYMLLLPTLYQLLLEHTDTSKLNCLSTVMVAGEACPPTLVAKHCSAMPNTGLYNEYGPTEATVWCIAHKIQQKDAMYGVPLGKPVAGAQIYLLDANKTPVPRGATGEIYIGGPSLSNGYLGRPDLTAKAFLPDPFVSESLASESSPPGVDVNDGSFPHSQVETSAVAGDLSAASAETANHQSQEPINGVAQLRNRLYRTGDLARYNADGNIEFLGRGDRQIKIRGYRVELGEIEKAIRTSEAKVSQVVVLAGDGTTGPQRISAYLVSEESLALVELKSSLKNKLPEYMVPSIMTQVDALPLLPNGKIDKVSLAQMAEVGTYEEHTNKKTPSNETEEKLLAIWQDILKIENIGVQDNFFELGGDSILSIQLIARAREAGMHLTPNQIFDNQTIATLANYVMAKEKPTEEWDYLVALRKNGFERPLFCIHAGGGHVFFYNILTKYIGEHRPIYALQASGVYAGKEMHHSIEDMARDYLQAIRSVQPTGPYNIMVYCFSVAVGHEMLMQLQGSGETANLIVMDTMTDPWKLDTGNRLRMRIKSFAKRLMMDPIKTVRGMIGERVVQLKLQLRKRMSQGDDKALARLNNNLAHICSLYRWRPHHQKVTLLLTEKPDKDINKEVVGSWKKVALGGVEVVPIEGNHIDLFAEPEVRIVAKNIEDNCV
ncbi:MAG: amino acid adenylation domain-containing protein [Pricia sp.]